MIGIVTQAQVRNHAGPPGGLIRVEGYPDRFRFDAPSLVGVALADVLGRQVDFSIVDGRAVCVRPVRNGGDS